MTIYVDRNEGIFPKETCDLMNIRSKILADLIRFVDPEDLNIPENWSRFSVFFKPITVTKRRPWEGGKGEYVSTIKIGSIKANCRIVGRCYIIYFELSDIWCDDVLTIPNVPDRPEFHQPYFESNEFFEVGTLDRTPQQRMNFRAIPLSPPEGQNPLATDKDGIYHPIGDAMLVEIKGRSINLKGRVLSGATIPVYGFFIQ